MYIMVKLLYFQDVLLLSVARVADIGALQPRSSRLVRLLLRHRILRPRQAEAEQQGHKSQKITPYFISKLNVDFNQFKFWAESHTF